MTIERADGVSGRWDQLGSLPWSFDFDAPEASFRTGCTWLNGN